jgi:hypothetical protein
MKIKLSNIVYMAGIMLLFVLPNFISAQTISIVSDQNSYNIGDSFLVIVKLNSLGQSVNAIGGTVLVSEDMFAVSNIETGKSFISLWVDKPVYVDGKIHFSGGLPGGYSDSDGIIFTFVARLKQNINTEIGLSDFEAFLNDGKGTAVSSLVLNTLKLSFNKNSTTTSDYQSDIDNIPPEKFQVVIDRDISIQNNKYFVSFFATDKGTGVSRYEVEEDPWIISWFGYKKSWPDAKNLQVLKYQNWISTIHVRAYDVVNNMTEETVVNYGYYIYYLLTLLISIFVIFNLKRWYNKKSIS